MRFVHRPTISTLFFLATLGAAFAQKVETDFDHQANFSEYKTYSWQEIKPANSLWDSRIKSAVDAQLAAKGWTQIASGGDHCCPNSRANCWPKRKVSPSVRG
jgi:hypothetical protein